MALILSIYGGHDAAVSIVDDGKVVFNLELERYTRKKHDYGVSDEFVAFCLSKAGLSIRDIDYVATNSGLTQWLERSGEKLFPNGLPPCLPHTPRLDSRSTLQPFETDLLGTQLKAYAVQHHLAHAAGAMFTAPFPAHDMVTVTYDGWGDGSNLSVCLQANNKFYFMPRNTLKIGDMWSHYTERNYAMPRPDRKIPGSGPGKIMGLASYGRKKDEIVEMVWEDLPLLDLFPSELASKGFNQGEDLSDTRQQRSADVAHAMELVTTSLVSRVFRRALSLGTRRRYIAYSGGIALNCVANSAAWRSSGAEDLYVPPNPNDCGLAMGAGLALHFRGLSKNEAFNGISFSPYLGPLYSAQEIGEQLSGLSKHGDFAIAPDAPVDRLVDVIEAGHVVAVFHGRSESGPRALGHRSLLARPDRPGVREEVNDRIKLREWYRPLAPMVLKEHIGELFSECVPSSPHMSTVAFFRKDVGDRFPGVCHVDYSCRPQYVDENSDAFVREVLTKFHRRTGIPLLLNTSFNRHAAIVETPAHAVEDFLQMPVRFLWLQGNLIDKGQSS